jgi:phage tail-like protein
MSDATAQPAAQPGTWVDPYRAYTFNLLIKNVDAGRFTEVRGLGVQVDRIAYQEAGLNAIERMVPGRVRYSPVELCYGLSAARELWDWLEEVRNGQVRREEVSVAVLDSTGGAEAVRWNLARAWPCEWRGSLLSTSSTELAIETLVLAHEGITRDKGGGAPTAAPAPAPAGG